MAVSAISFTACILAGFVAGGLGGLVKVWILGA